MTIVVVPTGEEAAAVEVDGHLVPRSLGWLGDDAPPTSAGSDHGDKGDQQQDDGGHQKKYGGTPN